MFGDADFSCNGSDILRGKLQQSAAWTVRRASTLQKPQTVGPGDQLKQVVKGA